LLFDTAVHPVAVRVNRQTNRKPIDILVFCVYLAFEVLPTPVMAIFNK